MSSDISSNTIPMDVDDPVALQRERNDSHTVKSMENNTSDEVSTDLTGHNSQTSSRSQTVVADSNPGTMDNDAQTIDQHPNLVVIDPQGDVFLRVVIGTEKEIKTFQASQTCLRLMYASSVDGDGEPRGPPSQLSWEVDFEEEANVLEMALRAAHLQHDKIPQYVSWKTIVHIAEVGKLQEEIAPLRPYLDGWVVPYVDKLLAPGYEMWLLVSYVFGYEDLFAYVLEHTALNMRIVESHDLETNEKTVSYVMPSGTEFSETTLGKDIIDALIHIRTEYITPIIDAAHSCIEKFLTPPDPSTICSQECHSMVLGSLMQNLKSLNLWPQKTPPSEITISALDLFANLHKMKIHAAKDHYWLDCSKELVWKFASFNGYWRDFLAMKFEDGHEPITKVLIAAQQNGHMKSRLDDDGNLVYKCNVKPVSATNSPPPSLLWKQSAIYHMGFRASDFLSEEEADDSGEGWMEENSSGNVVTVWEDSYCTDDQEEEEEEDEPEEEYWEDEDFETQSEEERAERGDEEDEGDVEMG